MNIRKSKSVKTQSRKAFSVIEIMFAVLICFIAIIGTSAHRYGAALNARRADLHVTAVRTATLLCEGWNGARGVTNFNPVGTFDSNVDIDESEGPDAPAGFTTLGSYKVNLDGSGYFVTLSWQNMATGLRALNVAVNWDPSGHDTGNFAKATKSYRLTTYVENPI
jgi:hypothetical protein